MSLSFKASLSSGGGRSMPPARAKKYPTLKNPTKMAIAVPYIYNGTYSSIYLEVATD